VGTHHSRVTSRRGTDPEFQQPGKYFLPVCSTGVGEMPRLRLSNFLQEFLVVRQFLEKKIFGGRDTMPVCMKLYIHTAFDQLGQLTLVHQIEEPSVRDLLVIQFHGVCEDFCDSLSFHR